ncbi:MAG: MotA/TolQ/ExbB proton channel family protein [Planctomycetota bacterium]|nr:MotA/TolQ/ExbB proton channel family protein [Planctomycetota bacterium]
MFRKASFVREFAVLCALGLLAHAGVSAADDVAGAGFLDMAKDSGFMEYVLLIVSIAGVALGLQALVSVRPHLLRPPQTSSELITLCQEGNIDEALELAQSDNTFLGNVAAAALSQSQLGKEAMEGAMADAGELESGKYIHKIGTLGLIAAIAPMLGLTGTTLGMIKTFAVIAVKADAVTASDMARGISIALVCTFTGLMVAIPLLILGFFLKSKLTHTIHEISNDVGEMIRAITGEGQTQ